MTKSNVKSNRGVIILYQVKKRWTVIIFWFNWLVLTRAERVLIRLDSCWLALIRTDLCWYSCIRIDLIIQWPQEHIYFKIMQTAIKYALAEVWTSTDYKKTLQLIFFSSLCYFWGTIFLMSGEPSSFVYISVISCQFLQIALSEYAL